MNTRVDEEDEKVFLSKYFKAAKSPLLEYFTDYGREFSHPILRRLCTGVKGKKQVQELVKDGDKLYQCWNELSESSKGNGGCSDEGNIGDYRSQTYDVTLEGDEEVRESENDYMSQHVKMVPMDLKEDKNEILALRTMNRFKTTFNKFKKVIDSGRKGKPLFQDLCMVNKKTVLMRAKKIRNRDSSYDNY